MLISPSRTQIASHATRGMRRIAQRDFLKAHAVALLAVANVQMSIDHSDDGKARVPLLGIDTCLGRCCIAWSSKIAGDGRQQGLHLLVQIKMTAGEAVGCKVCLRQYLPGLQLVWRDAGIVRPAQGD